MFAKTHNSKYDRKVGQCGKEGIVGREAVCGCCKNSNFVDLFSGSDETYQLNIYTSFTQLNN